jgi:hypothetical protein
MARPHSARPITTSALCESGAQSSASIICDLPTVTIRAPLSAFDTWELEEQLRHVDRILSGARFSTEIADDVSERNGTDSTTRAAAMQVADAPAKRVRRNRSRISWTIVAVGAGALACGITLLCAGALMGRTGWQSVGLPMTLLGQVALLLGMMWQMELVWSGKRETASKLYRFQKRLVDLEVLAAELAPEESEMPPAAADEQRLMAELKQRLDLLSHRLNSPCG